MSNRILLMTHSRIGEALLATAKMTLGGELPCAVDAINIPQQNTDPDFILNTLKQFVQSYENDGILILADMFGSTPCNIAQHLQEDGAVHVRLLSGLNLPMLIRALNYAHLDLSDLAEKAFEGGRNGVCVCTTNNTEKKISYDIEDCHHH